MMMMKSWMHFSRDVSVAHHPPTLLWLLHICIWILYLCKWNFNKALRRLDDAFPPGHAMASIQTCLCYCWTLTGRWAGQRSTALLCRTMDYLADYHLDASHFDATLRVHSGTIPVRTTQVKTNLLMSKLIRSASSTQSD